MSRVFVVAFLTIKEKKIPEIQTPGVPEEAEIN